MYCRTLRKETIVSEVKAKDSTTSSRDTPHNPANSTFWQLDASNRELLFEILDNINSFVPEDFTPRERRKLYRDLNDFCYYVPVEDDFEDDFEDDLAQERYDLFDSFMIFRQVDFKSFYRRQLAILDWAAQPWSKAKQITDVDAALWDIDDNPVARKKLYNCAHGLVLFQQRHELSQYDLLFIVDNAQRVRELHEDLEFQLDQAAAAEELFLAMAPPATDPDTT